jgi:CBS domain-containing protein
VNAADTIVEASRTLAQLGVGALPICGEDGTLRGVITERDIVVRVLAFGRDPNATTAGELGYGRPVTVGADNSIEEALKIMIAHDVRHLPVIDGNDLVGVININDITASISANIAAVEEGQSFMKSEPPARSREAADSSR